MIQKYLYLFLDCVLKVMLDVLRMISLLCKTILVNLKGGPLKGIPETKFTLRATYELDTKIGPVWLWLNHSYTGEFSASGVQRKLDEVPARETSNISASWWNNDRDLSVRMYINNVMNNKSIYSLSTSSDEQNYRKTGSPLSPRHYGIDIRYKF